MMMWILTKLPFLSTFAGFLTSKKRLLIEYALIATVITIAGFTFNLWLSKMNMQVALLETESQLVTVKQRLTTMELISDAQEQRIADLNDLRIKDVEALAGLLDDYKSISSHDTTMRKRLETLEKAHETVRDYLDRPIPAELVCLLDYTCTSRNSGRREDG